MCSSSTKPGTDYNERAASSLVHPSVVLSLKAKTKVLDQIDSHNLATPWRKGHANMAHDEKKLDGRVRYVHFALLRFDHSRSCLRDKIDFNGTLFDLNLIRPSIVD